MRSTLTAMATALFVGGCSPQTSDTVAELQPANVPEIGAITWPKIRDYCTFYADGHEFDAEDESTWQFVFVRSSTPSRRDAWGVAALDGERQLLDEVSRRAAGGTDVRRYQWTDNPEIEIVVTIVSAGRSEDSADLSGTIQVVAPARGEAVDFSGACRD